MVDITNFVYNKIKEAILDVAKTAKVEKQYQSTATSFPYVTIIDIDNTEISHTLDYQQRQSPVSWQIDIYANGGMREITAKKIAKAISEIMEDELHMRRVTAKPVTNVADTTIYRYMMIYDCKLDDDTQLIYS